MATYLDEILAAHRAAARSDSRPLEQLLEAARATGATRPFASALAAPGVSVIAEIKRRSPSKGDLAPHVDAAVLAKDYAAAGAACISVLTDERFFAGSATDLQVARGAIEVPVLRKDFTVSEADVCDARIMGADAVLLIAAALDDAELRAFTALTDELGMAALVEVHDEGEAARAIEAGAAVVGVNQRDLHTFEVDTDRAVRVRATLPSGVTTVAESGIRARADVVRLRDAGYHAVLVGESLVTADDPGAMLRELACS
ncbi:MAG: indole-3-glycerol phosphate synthase [Actinomycetota bacterium]